MLQIATELRAATDCVELRRIANEAADYLESIAKLEGALRKLHRVASESLIHDQLDESAKGHRIGTIDVTEALLKIF